MIDAADRTFLIPCSCIFCYITNSERMIDMIVEAINKRTGKTVKIEEAYSGQRLTCPHCGAGMHPVLNVPNPFFRCNEGQKHRHYLCAQLDGPSNKAYDPKKTDIEELFANLFRPVKESDPPILPPSGGVGPEEEIETGYLGTESKKGVGRGVDEKVDVGLGEELGDSENNTNHEPVILPCRTLSQLWKAGISKFKSYERIGSYLRSDVFLWFKDFDRFLARHESLGKRVIAVKPCWRADKINAIVFLSHSKILGAEKSKRKFFVLEFQKRKEYNVACKKLFSRNIEKNGTNNPKSKYDMVLVAGDWAELDEEESAVFVKPGENNYGVQRSTFFSKNQIYAIPEYKIKK